MRAQSDSQAARHRKIAQMVSAVELITAMLPAHRDLTLRDMWRLVPRSTRRSPKLRQAGPFAPESFTWQSASKGGAR